MSTPKFRGHGAYRDKCFCNIYKFIGSKSIFEKISFAISLAVMVVKVVGISEMNHCCPKPPQLTTAVAALFH